LNQKIVTLFKASNDIDADIVEIANQGEYDLLLIGLGQSIFEGTLLGKVLGYTTRIINPDRLIDKFIGKEGLFENSPFDERTRQIIAKSKMPIGILVDKDLTTLDQVFMPIFSPEDAFLMEFAQKLITNTGSKINIIDPNDSMKNNAAILEKINAIETVSPDLIALIEDRVIKKDFLSQQDIMLISLDSWKKLVNSQSTWLSNIPSVLIIKP
jgi:hypothetical protein